MRSGQDLAVLCVASSGNLRWLLSAMLSSSFLSLFCSVCCAAARYMMWVLQDIPEMNALGVERMIRGLALLQVSTATAAKPNKHYGMMR